MQSMSGIMNAFKSFGQVIKQCGRQNLKHSTAHDFMKFLVVLFHIILLPLRDVVQQHFLMPLQCTVYKLDKFVYRYV